MGGDSVSCDSILVSSFAEAPMFAASGSYYLRYSVVVCPCRNSHPVIPAITTQGLLGLAADPEPARVMQVGDENSDADYRKNGEHQTEADPQRRENPPPRPRNYVRKLQDDEHDGQQADKADPAAVA